MKNRLLFGTFAGLGIIIGAQWPELFSKWNNLIWIAVVLLAGFALRARD